MCLIYYSFSRDSKDSGSSVCDDIMAVDKDKILKEKEEEIIFLLIDFISFIYNYNNEF